MDRGDSSTPVSPLPEASSHHRPRLADMLTGPAGADRRSSSSSAHETTTLSANQVQLSIRCPCFDPSGDRPCVLSVGKETTIAQVKKLIERDWAGKPKAEGMRFIMAGRLLMDDELVASFETSSTDGSVLLHLVIRPDVWTEPRPMRQLPKSRSLSRESSHHRVSPAAEAPVTSGATTPARPRSPARSRSPFASRPATSLPARSPTFGIYPVYGASQAGPRNSPSASSAPAYQASQRFAQQLPKLYELLRRAGPNDQMLQHSLTRMHDMYVEYYERLWHAVYSTTESSSTTQGRTQTPTHLTLDADFRHLEAVAFGWGPVPSVDTLLILTPSSQSSTLHQRVEIDGLPYLLRVEENKALRAMNKHLNMIRERIQTLGYALDHMNAIPQASTDASGPSGAPSQNPPSNDPRSAEYIRWAIGNFTPQNPEDARIVVRSIQRGLAQTGARGLGLDRPPGAAINQRVIVRPAALMSRILTELAVIAIPLAFLILKLSILVYVLTRGAGKTKRYCIIGAAGVFVIYEGQRMLGRRRRARDRANQERARRALDQVRRGRGAQAQRPGTPGGTDRMGAPPNSTAQPRSSIPPLPALRAPRRFTVQASSQPSYWIERFAYLNLAQEDAELGLVAHDAPTDRPTGPPPARPTGLSHAFYAYVVLPLLLFVGTLVPEIESRRRAAIDARDNLIRSAALLEEGRKHAIAAQQAASAAAAAEAKAKASEAEASAKHAQAPERSVSQRTGEDVGTSSAHNRGSAPSEQTNDESAMLRSEYSERVLRQRGPGRRQINIQEELEAARAAAGDGDEEDLDAEEDMGFF
ncbi:hypothetical protein CBOM_00648 [Ceraceosorus bombacis]|uniref:Ubiquitin-like domain-containing protein n=1 Tax=Ceraceosorus bombacis TaxID=401625 RepID=A0A0P1BA51_9BASI|nr:hypothetical protein CBOM_00648 [Ceraceosorus bombacis]